MDALSSPSLETLRPRFGTVDAREESGLDQKRSMQQEAWRSDGRLASIECARGRRLWSIQQGDGRQDGSEWDIGICGRRGGHLAGAPSRVVVFVTGHVVTDRDRGQQVDMGVSRKAVSDKQGNTREEKWKNRTSEVAPGLHRPHATCGHLLVSSDEGSLRPIVQLPHFRRPLTQCRSRAGAHGYTAPSPPSHAGSRRPAAACRRSASDGP
jgi:hypothetical protein